MNSKYHIGDRVRLTEGGPIMTVKEAKSGKLTCSWYVTGEGWKQKIFTDAALKRVGKSRSPDR